MSRFSKCQYVNFSINQTVKLLRWSEFIRVNTILKHFNMSIFTNANTSIWQYVRMPTCQYPKMSRCQDFSEDSREDFSIIFIQYVNMSIYVTMSKILNFFWRKVCQTIPTACILSILSFFFCLIKRINNKKLSGFVNFTMILYFIHFIYGPWAGIGFYRIINI